jgi:hypothetical protein
MSDVTVASTTDSEEDVKIAAGIPAEDVESKEEAGSEEDEESSKAAAESEAAEPEGDKKPKSAAASEAAKSEEEESEEDEEPKKGKGGFQKRIDNLTKEKYDLRDENRELRERLTKLEESLKKADPQVEVKEDAKPTRDKFKTDEEYYEALGRHSAKEEIKKSEAEAAQRQANEDLAVTFENYNEGVEEFRTENPDFDEVVGDSKLIIPMAVQNAIISYEREGAPIAYYLAKNPEVVAELKKMNDVRAVSEIGRIHSRFYPDAEPEEKKVAPPAKKPVAKAPAPVRPVRGTATSTSVPLDELPYADYRKARDAQERGRIRR